MPYDPLGYLNVIGGSAPGAQEAQSNQQWLQQQMASQPQQATPTPQQGEMQPQQGAPQIQVPQDPAGNPSAIKRLLSNFFSGAGDAMLKHAGLPTPYEQQQKAFQNQVLAATTEANANLHSAMAGMYGTVPIQVPDASDPSGFSTINVMQKDVPKIQASQIAAASRQNVAQTAGQFGVQKAQIMQGMQIPITPELRQMLPDLPEGTQSIPLRQLNQLVGIETKPLQVIQGARGPAEFNKLTQGVSQIPVGNPRAMFAPENRYMGVVDPNNPDNIIPMKAGQAAAQGAALPGSVGFQANKAVTKSATSGPIANQLTAFSTAIQHAALLKQAATAMQNGDVRTLNTLKNRAATEFGDSDLTNFNAIAGAYSREITKMLSGGHMTDAEIASAGGTLPANANLATITKVLDSYRSLAQSKINVLRNQVTQGKKGVPAFNQESTAPSDMTPFQKFMSGRKPQ